MTISDATPGRVVVLGSVNADLVLRIERLPTIGETIVGATLEHHPGGKGANQAAAAAACGADVELVARVGADEAGRRRLQELNEQGVGTSHVKSTEDVETGLAVVMVTAAGDNAIVVASAANSCLSEQDVDAALPLISSARVLVAQLEVPLTTICHAVERVTTGPQVVLNCAPYRPLPETLFEHVDVLVANAGEAAELAGESLEHFDAERSAIALLKRGPRAVVITLGGDGAFVAAADSAVKVAAPRVRVVDTTGAGDAFVGALAARLAAGAELVDAVRFGVAVGSRATEHRGASVPPSILATLAAGS